jgi:hypothetical protein
MATTRLGLLGIAAGAVSIEGHEQSVPASSRDISQVTRLGIFGFSMMHAGSFGHGTSITVSVSVSVPDPDSGTDIEVWRVLGPSGSNLWRRITDGHR